MLRAPTSVPRDENGVAHIVSLSGGKDSSCMALALKYLEPRPYCYIYTPTGNELPAMAKHIGHLSALLNASIIELTNGTLNSQIEIQGMLPNTRARWCTRLLKLKPAGLFYKEHAPAVCYVGLREDEDEREGTRPGGDSAPIGSEIQQDFPFQRWSWGLEDILNFLSAFNIRVPERTDCAKCPYQRLGEWYNLWLHHLDLYLEAEADEIRFGHTYRSDKRDSWPTSLYELRLLFEMGQKPERSLNMMAKRQNMCRACTL